MADAYGQQQQDGGFDPDVREWSPELRRRVSIGIFAMTAVLAILGTIFYFAAPSTAGWVLIVAIVLLVILLLAEVAIVATGIATEDNTGPAWLRASSAQAATAGQAAPPPRYDDAAAQTTEIDLRCPECQELFTVQDTGQRPLEIDCPHCGAHGQVDLPEGQSQEHAHQEHAHEDPGAQTQAGGGLADEPLPGFDDEEEAAEAEADLPTLSLKCPACDTQFEVEDDGDRPLKTTCPGCGKSGKLK